MGGPLKIELSGSFDKAMSFFGKVENPNSIYSDLERLAQQGVIALQAATPVDSSLTAYAWGYEISINSGDVKIGWTNTNKAGDTHVVILLQYGHGTGTGGYVAGRDFINTALEPVFNEISDSVWKKVTSA